MKTVKVRGVELGVGVPKIIVPIVAKERKTIIEKAKEITELPADLVEWRADFYQDLFNTPELLYTLKELRGTLGNTPILFTIRTKPEGGETAPSIEDYTSTNTAIAQSGNADMIDVEMFRENTDWNGQVSEMSSQLTKEIHSAGCLVVGSRHNFTCTPSKAEIVTTLRHQQEAGADIPKVAVMPKSRADVMELLSASVEFADKYADRPFLTISMGARGMITRTACELSGSCMTFGAAGQGSAPGQIQVRDLKGMLELVHKSSQE